MRRAVGPYAGDDDDDAILAGISPSPDISESEYQAYLENEEQLRMIREAEGDPEYEAYLEQNEQDRLAREAGFDADPDDDYREFRDEEDALYMQQMEDERDAYEAYNNRYGDEDEEDEDMEYGMREPLTRDTEFAGVEVVLPRRSFRGAANIETVKDCEHRTLGSRPWALTEFRQFPRAEGRQGLLRQRRRQLLCMG